MKKELKKGIIDAHLTEESIHTFVGQIGVCAIVAGLYFHSWIVFGASLLVPLCVFLFSSKIRWCQILSIVFSCIYALIWACVGFLIGSVFSLSASIVLMILFLFPGAGYNWMAIDYFRAN